MQGLLRAGKALRRGAQAAKSLGSLPGSLNSSSQSPQLSSHGTGLISTSLHDTCRAGQPMETPFVSSIQILRLLSASADTLRFATVSCDALRVGVASGDGLRLGTSSGDTLSLTVAAGNTPTVATGSGDTPIAEYRFPCPGADGLALPVPSQPSSLPPFASCLATNASCTQLASCPQDSAGSSLPQVASRSFAKPCGSVRERSHACFASGAHQKRPFSSYLSHSPLSLHTPLTSLTSHTPLTPLSPALSLHHTRMQHTQEHSQAPKQRAAAGQGREQRPGGRGPGQETQLVSEQEDVFDSITDKIPERPVTVAEGASYSFVILLGLGIALGAMYFAAKELLLEPKEYKVFNRALTRVQRDAQVVSYLGSPITGYGQESRNRAARQRISHKVWKDEEGVEKTLVQFHVRGPGGAGLVHCEMFQDPGDKGKLKFTYLVVDITTPVPRRLMLESYVPE